MVDHLPEPIDFARFDDPVRWHAVERGLAFAQPGCKIPRLRTNYELKGVDIRVTLIFAVRTPPDFVTGSGFQGGRLRWA